MPGGVAGLRRPAGLRHASAVGRAGLGGTCGSCGAAGAACEAPADGLPPGCGRGDATAGDEIDVKLLVHLSP